MRTHLIGIAVLAAVGGCVIEGDSSLTVRNRSSRVIEEVHLAKVFERDWGPDLLRGSLFPGDDLVIDRIECAHYDVLVVDGPTAACVLPDLRMCFDDATWTITDATFATCTTE